MDNLPTHIGFIVDGNRRWAKEHNLPTLEGHRRGLAQVELIAEQCFQRGISCATFYLFSSDNWSRSTEEVGYLMALARTEVSRLAKKLAKNNIKLAILGSRTKIDQDLLDSLDAAEALTSACTGGTLGICFNYSGYQEIADAASKIQGAITPDSIAKNLYHPEIPALDLIVRTSGEQRLSGFMLWRTTYAELLFLQKYWPDITPADLDEILAEYTSRHRRFGK